MIFGQDNVSRYHYGSLYASDIEGAQPTKRNKRKLMTNAGGHVLSNVDLGHIYPYQSLRPNAKNIYTKLHDDTFNTVFGCQVTDDAAEKQYTKKSLEWSTVGKGDVLKKALTNNPPELPKMQYGYDSVDMLQNKMSEGNLKSKVKKDVFNFYGMDPPPTGHPER